MLSTNGRHGDAERAIGKRDMGESERERERERETGDGENQRETWRHPGRE